MVGQSVAAGGSDRWRALALLAVVLILSMSTWFSASAVVPQLRETWNLSPLAASGMTIAVQIGFVCGAIVSSLTNLSDVVAPRHVILGGSIGAASVNALLGAAGGAAWGLPLRLATGFFLAGVYPPACKLLSTWFQGRRGLALGVLVGALVLGNGTPHLVNGLGGLDWQVVIFVTSISTLMGGLLAEFAVREGPCPFAPGSWDPRQAGRLFTNRAFRLTTLGYVGHMWELYAVYAWFSAFFSDALVARGVPVGTVVAYGTFAIFVTGAAGCWLGGVLADRWGRCETASLMMALSGGCAVLIGLLFGSSPWLVLALGLVWGFTVVADSAQFSTMVTESADQSHVGTALTLQLASGFTISVATIWLIPILQQRFGWEWAFAFLAPGPLLGGLAMLRLRSLPEAVSIGGGRAARQG